MIKASVNASLAQLNQFAKKVTVIKKKRDDYDATTDTYGGEGLEYEARVLLYRDDSRGLTRVPTGFDWEEGDEIKIGAKYLYVANVVNKADSAIVLTLEGAR